MKVKVIKITNYKNVIKMTKIIPFLKVTIKMLCYSYSQSYLN